MKKYRVKISNFVFGVPPTFIVDNYNPEQFKIITCACGNSWANYKDTLLSLNFNPNMKYGGGLGTPLIDGKPVYSRILIKFK